MEFLKFKIIGYKGSQLLLNNPQQVDPFNKYAKLSKEITGKRKKTDEDMLNLREIEMRSKIYWSDDVGVFVPGSWITAAVAGLSFSKAKIPKKEIRGAVFAERQKLKLNYRGMNGVKEPLDIVKNPEFCKVMNLKQGQVRICKAVPQFHDWSFECELSFDNEIIDKSTLKNLIELAAKYGGFGDFRPTFGRAEVEFINE